MFLSARPRRRSRNARRKGRTRRRLLVIDPSFDVWITNCCRTSFSNSKNRRQVVGKRWEEDGTRWKTRQRKTYSDAHLQGLPVSGRAFLLFFGIIIKVGARYRSSGLTIADRDLAMLTIRRTERICERCDQLRFRRYKSAECDQQFSTKARTMTFTRIDRG